jgi:DNA-binding transcriptional regulator GbsR (MarR family)
MILAMEEKGLASAGPDRSAAAQLSPPETEIIDFCVQLSRLLGQPRSMAEIYGLLFVSGRPPVMDCLIERLQLSIQSRQKKTRKVLSMVVKMLGS